ncbi:MAG: nucleotide exchange factor GrpE [Rickettsiaceae bacterium]|nr:MAG: nucleotide exchange factor GrpE [Rickettsiaceae bacterium]
MNIRDKEHLVENEIDIKEQIDENIHHLNPSEENNISNIESLETEIDRLKKEVSNLSDKLLRTAAEHENSRKRFEKSAQEAKEYANVSFAKDLLNVVDNLARALEHKPSDVDAQVSNVLSGVEMTYNELINIFKNHGLETIEPKVGDKFDYNLHHAVMKVIEENYDENNIVDLVQVGYKFKERLIRPAMVKIAQKPF